MQGHCANTLAPVAVFAFNRPDHLRRALDALAANELAVESDVTVFCDGPRYPKEAALTAAVREIAHAAVGFRSRTVVEREKNLGLAASIISGVTEIVRAASRIIVLEDDLLTSPFFLRYMNDGLNCYAGNPQVASIHAWSFPHRLPDAPETFFLRGTGSWGWATWKRAWDLFEPDANKLLSLLEQRKLLRAVDLDGAYDLNSTLLRGYAQGRNSSWDSCWYASAFLADMLTLYPGHSLVHNFGHDGSGVHCGPSNYFDVPLAETPVRVMGQPVMENERMCRTYKKFWAGGSAYRLWRRVLRRRRKDWQAAFMKQTGKLWNDLRTR